MQRIATTVALASWVGFLMVSAAIRAAETWAALDIRGSELLQGAPVRVPHPAGGAAGVWLEAGTILALVVAAGLVGRALFGVHGPDRRRRRQGEHLALGALALVGAIGAADRLTGLIVFPEVAAGATFWALLVLSALAVAFDPLVEVDPNETHDHEAFEAGVAALAQGMARQTRLYARSHQENGNPTP